MNILLIKHFVVGFLVSEIQRVSVFGHCPYSVTFPNIECPYYNTGCPYSYIGTEYGYSRYISDTNLHTILK